MTAAVVFGALGGWTLLAALGTAGVARAAHVLKGRRRAAPRAYPRAVPEPVRRMTVLPPVPPTDAEWDRFLRLINEEAA